MMPSMSKTQIEAVIPHRKPMLLVDEVLEQTDTTIHCTKIFGADAFFRDIFPISRWYPV
jgi:3-hydroxyacyl-[acyl-carrier-protein] dehydratase